MRKTLKPEIGQTIYIRLAGDNDIYNETVGYFGEKSFIVAGYKKKDEIYREFEYADYGKTWSFTPYEMLKKGERLVHNDGMPEYCYAGERR
jgi:hypothetical protein